MKILLLGDASNFHYNLAVGLAKIGHDVTVASNGSNWMCTKRDIDISRDKSRIGGAVLWIKLNTLLWPHFKGYDIVQLCGIGFIEQKPKRIKIFFDKIRRNNDRVFLTALAADPLYVRMCIDADCPLKYNEWRVNSKPTIYAQNNPNLLQSWLDADFCELTHHIYENVDGVATALYEYHLNCSKFFDANKIEYTGIPIDISDPPHISKKVISDKLNILWACHRGRETEKGADQMLRVLRDIECQESNRINIDVVQNIPFEQFKKRLDSAHIVVDQLYSYTPATTALMAMAKGKIAITGGERDYYTFINEHELCPIINPDPENPYNIKEQIDKLVENPDLLYQMSIDSRRLVEKHNSIDVVSKRFEKLWNKTII